jgi:hypothetical protein
MGSELKELISALRGAIETGGLHEELVREATDKLSTMGYKYDYGNFPALINTTTFVDMSGNTPGNLAEALLWKLGRWKAYKGFLQSHSAKNAKPTATNVVLHAFAQHLKDPENPIYDQHALRALWAISGKLSVAEQLHCKNALFSRDGMWKSSASGSSTTNCYEFFLRHIADLVSVANAPSKGALDRLLMPLGQALKERTGTYIEFCSLFGFPDAI